MGRFSDGIRKDAEQILKNINSSITQVAQDAGNLVINFSPTRDIGARWAEGVFVNSWYVAVNEFDGSGAGPADMSGSGSKSRVDSLQNSKAFYRQDGFISIVNNLDYSQQVEFDGWRQTPAYAPVRQTVLYLLGAYKK